MISPGCVTGARHDGHDRGPLLRGLSAARRGARRLGRLVTAMALCLMAVALLVVALACLGVPLVDDACAVLLVTAATCLWRRVTR